MAIWDKKAELHADCTGRIYGKREKYRGPAVGREPRGFLHGPGRLHRGPARAIHPGGLPGKGGNLFSETGTPIIERVVAVRGVRGPGPGGRHALLCREHGIVARPGGCCLLFAGIRTGTGPQVAAGAGKPAADRPPAPGGVTGIHREALV